MTVVSPNTVLLPHDEVHARCKNRVRAYLTQNARNVRRRDFCWGAARVALLVRESPERA